MEPTVHAIHEPVTGTWQYIVADPESREAVIIDSVLDYNKDTGIIVTTSADGLLEVVKDQGYIVSRILETHAHADHLTASRYLQYKLATSQNGIKPTVCIGQRITQVQDVMGDIYNIPEAQMKGAFDHTFSDDEHFRIGNIEAKVIHLPGHTPDHMGYVVGSNIFMGDSMFNPDLGSARCDFPGGSAVDLYHSMQKLLDFPADYRLYTGHDYPPKDSQSKSGELVGAVPYTTVEVQSKENKHVKLGTQMEEFVRMRSDRDQTLSEPKLLRQSMHVNVRGGRLPATAEEGFEIYQRPMGIPIAA